MGLGNKKSANRYQKERQRLLEWIEEKDPNIKGELKKGNIVQINRRLIELLKPAGPEMHDGETERDLAEYEVSDHLRICIEGEINTCR